MRPASSLAIESGILSAITTDNSIRSSLRVGTQPYKRYDPHQQQHERDADYRGEMRGPVRDFYLLVLFHIVSAQLVRLGMQS